MTAKAPGVLQGKIHDHQRRRHHRGESRAWAPLGADRFYNLVKGGFYKDAAFFRMLPRFVAQFGIPARPEVAAAWDHAYIRMTRSRKRTNAAR